MLIVDGVDWWALGVLTYEMLSGNPPYSNDNVQQLLAEVSQIDCTYSHDINTNLYVRVIDRERE